MSRSFAGLQKNRDDKNSRICSLLLFIAAVLQGPAYTESNDFSDLTSRVVSDANDAFTKPANPALRYLIVLNIPSYAHRLNQWDKVNNANLLCLLTLKSGFYFTQRRVTGIKAST